MGLMLEYVLGLLRAYGYYLQMDLKTSLAQRLLFVADFLMFPIFSMSFYRFLGDVRGWDG